MIRLLRSAADCWIAGAGPMSKGFLSENSFHAQHFSLFDWLIDWSMWIDWFESVIKACFAVCQDRKRSSKCCKHTRLMISIMWISCGFHWVEVTVPRCEFVGCGACSQGIRQAELCCTLVQMAHGDPLWKYGAEKLQIQPQVVGILLGPWIWKRKIKLIWLLLARSEVVVSMFCFLVWLIFGKCWGNVKALQFAFMLSETEMCVFRHLWRESYRRISVATTYRLPVHGWAARVSLCNGRVRSSSSTASHKKSPTWTW